MQDLRGRPGGGAELGGVHLAAGARGVGGGRGGAGGGAAGDGRPRQMRRREER